MCASEGAKQEVSWSLSAGTLILWEMRGSSHGQGAMLHPFVVGIVEPERAARPPLVAMQIEPRPVTHSLMCRRVRLGPTALKDEVPAQGQAPSA